MSFSHSESAQQAHDFTYSPVAAEKPATRVAISESQTEEDTVSFRKFILDGDFLSSLFSGFLLAYLLGHLRQILRACKQLAYFSYRRWYLLFRVFQI
ncbi:hypothetical protein [Rufibacter soli]